MKICGVNLRESKNLTSPNSKDNSGDIKLTTKEVALKIDESVYVFRTGIEELKSHILNLQRESVHHYLDKPFIS
ncbi:hypothetical protein [Priestia endophytica]|uniref:Uncharacterized protein n=1 Tax=Priestia endophytica TaxID=135735 RepID=A0AAX1Q8G1_9BACI|nr:hypothetical protein [Priestia endophytica]RAS76709.1 hypothetical protein A3864_12880 [Priestia endophytica]